MVDLEWEIWVSMGLSSSDGDRVLQRWCVNSDDGYGFEVLVGSDSYGTLGCSNDVN